MSSLGNKKRPRNCRSLGFPSWTPCTRRSRRGSQSHPGRSILLSKLLVRSSLSQESEVGLAKIQTLQHRRQCATVPSHVAQEGRLLPPGLLGRRAVEVTISGGCCLGLLADSMCKKAPRVIGQGPLSEHTFEPRLVLVPGRACLLAVSGYGFCRQEASAIGCIKTANVGGDVAVNGCLHLRLYRRSRQPPLLPSAAHVGRQRSALTAAFLFVGRRGTDSANVAVECPASPRADQTNPAFRLAERSLLEVGPRVGHFGGGSKGLRSALL